MWLVWSDKVRWCETCPRNTISWKKLEAYLSKWTEFLVVLKSSWESFEINWCQIYPPEKKGKWILNSIYCWWWFWINCNLNNLVFDFFLNLFFGILNIFAKEDNSQSTWWEFYRCQFFYNPWNCFTFEKWAYLGVKSEVRKLSLKKVISDYILLCGIF